MKLFCTKTPLALLVLLSGLLFPLGVIAGTNVALLNASGGPGGSPFVDMALSKGRIVAITVRSGSFIDSIQLTYQYGNKRIVGAHHGGKGGRSRTFKLKAGEVITEFSGRSGKFVDSIYIKTNKNRSKKWGGAGGSRAFKFIGTEKSPILGIWGHSGTFLDSIGVIKSNKRTRAANTQQVSDFKQPAVNLDINEKKVNASNVGVTRTILSNGDVLITYPSGKKKILHDSGVTIINVDGSEEGYSYYSVQSAVPPRLPSEQPVVEWLNGMNQRLLDTIRIIVGNNQQAVSYYVQKETNKTGNLYEKMQLRSDYISRLLTN